jgi:hypothetical protein
MLDAHHGKKGLRVGRWEVKSANPVPILLSPFPTYLMSTWSFAATPHPGADCSLYTAHT